MRLWMLLFVVGATACGGQVSGSPDGGGDARASSSGGGSGSGGSGGSGGGGGVEVPLCPGDPPILGSRCVTPGQGCAYLIAQQCLGYRCSSTSGWKRDPTITCP